MKRLVGLGQTRLHAFPCVCYRHVFFCSTAILALVGIDPLPVHAQHRVYFGNLHAHSNLSDGYEQISPEAAFAFARDVGHLDFLCLSEHNHMIDEAEYEHLQTLAASLSTNGFVALFGQEFSTINSGFNHTNIEGYPVVIPGTMNGKYRQVFEDVATWLAANPTASVVAGFNHPGKITTDYGLDSDFDQNWAAFVGAMDPIVKLIAVSNGPADASNKNLVLTASQQYGHPQIRTARWFEYLSRGMHLAPKIDHDTHSNTYGIRNDGRTAVWIEGEFTQQSLLKALSDRHCYATEDRNLSVVARVNGTRLPGDRLGATDELHIELSLSDADEPGAKYTVRVYQGFVNSEDKPKKLSGIESERTGNGALTVTVPNLPSSPSFCVVWVEQESSNAPCGSDDDAWLAPVWVNDALEDDLIVDSYAFAGSKHTKVYHYPMCEDLNRIKPANLVHFDTAPDGRSLHKNCPRIADDQ